jgi:hypothetical protein
MTHKPPDCQIDLRKDENGKANAFCLTHNNVWICSVCHNNKEAHYVGPKLMHSQDEYAEAEELLAEHKGGADRKCECTERQCAKCLGVNCQDKGCLTHTKEAKIAWRKRWEISNNKTFPHKENF